MIQLTLYTANDTAWREFFDEDLVVIDDVVDKVTYAHCRYLCLEADAISAWYAEEHLEVWAASGGNFVAFMDAPYEDARHRMYVGTGGEILRVDMITDEGPTMSWSSPDYGEIEDFLRLEQRCARVYRAFAGRGEPHWIGGLATPRLTSNAALEAVRNIVHSEAMTQACARKGSPPVNSDGREAFVFEARWYEGKEAGWPPWQLASLMMQHIDSHEVWAYGEICLLRHRQRLLLWKLGLARAAWLVGALSAESFEDEESDG